MKSVVVLYAGGVTERAFAPVLGGSSAWDKALDWAFSVPDAASVVVFSRDGAVLPEVPPVRDGCTCTVVSRPSWTVSLLIKSLAEVSAGYDTIFFQWADCPFTSMAVTKDLYERHCRYAAEYTFADGYPVGFAPEVLAPGIASILSVVAHDNAAEPERDALFSVLKKDINSYEIETALAPRDMRYLRLTLACDTKRNTAQCARLNELAGTAFDDAGTAASAAESCRKFEAFVSKSPEILRTLPAFYNVQIAGRCPFECSFCPYPAVSRERFGVGSASRTDFMPIEDFRKLVHDIEDFSGDAVIALSLWGEPLFHPDFIGFVEAVLEHPSLSLLIETTGAGLSSQTADAVAALVASAPRRINGQRPVSWILSLDSVKEAQYGALHGTGDGGFTLAISAAEKLISRFPGAVWPQFLRLKENEAEMEAFYRFWSDKAGQVIIQKYDWFCGELPDKKTADLSPLSRCSCWHLRRDMAILLDGSVPLCREDIHCRFLMGNVHTDSLETIWRRGEGVFADHLNNKYEGICGACDEYYTYNF